MGTPRIVGDDMRITLTFMKGLPGETPKSGPLSQSCGSLSLGGFD